MAKGKYPEEITVTVLGWDKYNPRTDVKKNWWFKFSNDFFFDDKIRSLTTLERLSYVFVLTLASKKCSKSFQSVTKVDSKLFGSKRPTEYFQALKALERNGLVTISVPQRRGEERREDIYAQFEQQELTCGEPLPLVAESKNSLQKTEKQKPAGEEKKKRVTPDKPAFDFEALYQKYPRKRGKTRGMKIAERDIRTQKEYDNLSLAIDKYCQVIKKEKTDQKYIQLFSTFMNNWLDWLEDGTVKIFDSFEFISAEQFQINQIESLPKSE